jgi:uncharacterized membrane protein (DUF485 family)
MIWCLSQIQTFNYYCLASPATTVLSSFHQLKCEKSIYIYHIKIHIANNAYKLASYTFLISCAIDSRRNLSFSWWLMAVYYSRNLHFQGFLSFSLHSLETSYLDKRINIQIHYTLLEHQISLFLTPSIVINLSWYQSFIALDNRYCRFHVATKIIKKSPLPFANMCPIKMHIFTKCKDLQNDLPSFEWKNDNK